MKLNEIAILMVVLCMLAIETQAQQLYKWVDAQGVTHYSETLPSQDIDHATFEFTEDYQVSNSQDDYYSIQNQLKRLQERRAQQRAEKQQALKEKEVKQQVPEIIYVQAHEPEGRYYLPVYYPRYNSYHYNKHYNGYRPKHRSQKPYLDKPRSGISQKVKVNRSGAVFSATR
ncbi:MAG: DUF4124 domain-containing protein [Gammaproteobacteria bacterium]|nr:DUF4124 domain-containing protein [Gammaproteobacteria bacterium]